MLEIRRNIEHPNLRHLHITFGYYSWQGLHLLYLGPIVIKWGRLD